MLVTVLSTALLVASSAGTDSRPTVVISAVSEEGGLPAGVARLLTDTLVQVVRESSSFSRVVSSADAAPNQQTLAVYADITGRIDAELAKLEKLLQQDLAAFNRLVREKELPAVVAKQEKKEAPIP